MHLPHFLSESLKGWMMPLSPAWSFNSSSYVGRWESALTWAALPTERWGRAVMTCISGSKFLCTILGCTVYYPSDLHLLSVTDRSLVCKGESILILPLGPKGQSNPPYLSCSFLLLHLSRLQPSLKPGHSLSLPRQNIPSVQHPTASRIMGS